MSMVTESIVSVPDMQGMAINCTIFQIREFIGNVKDVMKMASDEHYSGRHDNAHLAVLEAFHACHRMCRRIDEEIAQWEETIDRQAEADRLARTYESLPVLEVT